MEGKEQQTQTLSPSSGSLQETELGGGQREMDVQVCQWKVGRINPSLSRPRGSESAPSSPPGEGRGSGEQSALMVL